MDRKRRRNLSPDYDSPGVVDVVVLGDGRGWARTRASLRLARCNIPHRILSVPLYGSLTALLRSSRRDVVLLRSGTEVFKGWLDRLAAAIRENADIGSAIPFSDSGPFSGYPTPHGADPEAQVALDWATLDRVAGTANFRCSVDVPFPSGCCIYLRRDYLDDLLNEEEIGAGWRHILAANVCVRLASVPGDPVCIWPAELPAHPFGAAAVASYLRADAARFWRRRLDLARLAGPGPAMLLVTHFGGGGTERHVHDLAHALEDEGVRALVLRPLTTGGVRLERFTVPSTPNLVFHPDKEYYSLLDALAVLEVRHVHVHHTLGHTATLRQLIDDLNVAYDYTLHDYRVICPRIHLADRTGRYCGEPGPDECNNCLAQNGNYYNIRDTTEIRTWRERGHFWLAGARRVFIPHADVGDRLGRYFPDVQFVERRHMETLTHARFIAAPRLPGQPLRVALLGTLYPHKGSDLLLGCARDARRRNLPLEFVVLGTSDRPAILNAAGVDISGEYREEEIYDLLEAKACHCALFLTILPETYCYTLSIALAGGLYCLALDLGAQGARVADSGWGEVLPLASSPEEINDRLLATGDTLHRLRPVPPPIFAAYPSILQDYYGLEPNLRVPGEADPMTLVPHPTLSEIKSWSENGGYSLRPVGDEVYGDSERTEDIPIRKGAGRSIIPLPLSMTGRSITA